MDHNLSPLEAISSDLNYHIKGIKRKYLLPGFFLLVQNYRILHFYIFFILRCLQGNFCTTFIRKQVEKYEVNSQSPGMRKQML